MDDGQRVQVDETLVCKGGEQSETGQSCRCTATLATCTNTYPQNVMEHHARIEHGVLR